MAGWVRTYRNDRLIALNDGRTIRYLQCVINQEKVDAAIRARFTMSAAVKCTREPVPSQGSGQRVGLKIDSVEVLGDSDAEKYPVHPRSTTSNSCEQAHLRFRTITCIAVIRMRHQVSFSFHQYFGLNGYNYFHAPVITTKSAEGAGRCSM